MDKPNLIPMARRRARRQRERVRRCAAAVGLYAAALAVACAAVQVRWHVPVEPARQKLAQAKAELERTQRAAAALRPVLEERQRAAAAAAAVAVRPDWSVLLRATAATLDDDVVLRSCQVAALEGEAGGGYEYTLRAVARSQAAAAAFVLRLEASGLFEKVTLVDSRAETLAGQEAVGLRVRCELTGRTRGTVAEAQPEGEPWQ